MRPREGRAPSCCGSTPNRCSAVKHHLCNHCARVAGRSGPSLLMRSAAKCTPAWKAVQSNFDNRPKLRAGRARMQTSLFTCDDAIAGTTSVNPKLLRAARQALFFSSFLYVFSASLMSSSTCSGSGISNSGSRVGSFLGGTTPSVFRSSAAVCFCS